MIFQWLIISIVSDEKFAGSDTVATSYTLAKAIRKIGEYDYIFCGDCSVDGETGQISYDLASELKLDHLGKISKVDYADDTLKLFRTQNDMEYCYGARRPMIISFGSHSMIATNHCISVVCALLLTGLCSIVCAVFVALV